jgi:hypothetical protein
MVVTRFVVKSERVKVAQQVTAEHRLQARAKRADTLLEAISELLAETDPQVKAAFDYGRVVSLIHRVQLVLSPDDPEEANLNGAVNRLGLELQNYIPLHKFPAQERMTAVRQLLEAHSDVSTLAGRVLRR